MIANDSHIWCPNCNAIVQLLRDFMSPNDKNAHAATDLICIKCALVIATIHHLEPSEATIRKARGEV